MGLVLRRTWVVDAPHARPSARGGVGVRVAVGIGLAATLGIAACASNPPPAAAGPATGESTAAASLATPPPSSSAVATPAPTPPPPATPSDVMESSRSRFDACYARARAADPRLGRTWVEITFTIDETGTPTTVDLQYRNRFDDPAKECMRDAALSLKFPASMQGTRSGKIAFAPPAPSTP